MKSLQQALKTSQLPIVAVFDFDGTLTLRDSLLPFLRFAFGSWRFCWGMIFTSPVLTAYALKLIPNWQAKEILLSHFLANKTTKQIDTIARKFARNKIPKIVRDRALARLQWHQKQGHQTILLSASLETYLSPWALTMGFDRVIGTQLEIKNGRFTGCILGKNCYGPEKVRRLQSVLGDLSQYYIYSYGDSRGDRELLDTSDSPFYRKFD